MPTRERRTQCRTCGIPIRTQYLVYHLKMNHPDEKSAADPTFIRKRANARTRATCPICHGAMSAHVLDWHLRKWHDADQPIALVDHARCTEHGGPAS